MTLRTFRPLLAGAAAVATLSLALAGCASPSGSSGDADAERVVVGSANFSESQVVAEIYALALENAGVEVERAFNIGSREVYIPALEDGSIDVIPDYQGALLSYLDPEVTGVTEENLASELESVLPEGLVMLPASPAQNVNVLAVTEETAAEYDLTTISDLAPHAADMSEGSGPEWQTRQEGDLGLKDVYGITFGTFTALDAAGPLTLAAVKNGQVDVGVLTSTDPGVADLVVLDDDKGLFLPQFIAPVLREDVDSDTVSEVLDAVSAALTTDDLVAMNTRINVDRDSVEDVAADWIADKGL
jgi:osmoprotectant transport system substrate-binding protein